MMVVRIPFGQSVLEAVATILPQEHWDRQYYVSCNMEALRNLAETGKSAGLFDMTKRMEHTDTGSLMFHTQRGSVVFHVRDDLFPSDESMTSCFRIESDA